MNSVSVPNGLEVVVQTLEEPFLFPGTRAGSRDQQTPVDAIPEAKSLRKRILDDHETEEDHIEEVRVDKRNKSPGDDMKRGSNAGTAALASDEVRLRKRRLSVGALNRSNAGPPTPISLSGIDILISGYGLFPHDLSALTTIYHAVVALDIIRSEPSRFSGLLARKDDRKDTSYFSYIGPRYGSSDCLDHALRCLFSKTKSILVPASAVPEAVILSQYDQALASLQDAVNSSRWADPEVLCATSILALFELFNSPTLTYWSHHVAGAARLIQSRGPERFTTDFDKALFKAMYPAIGTECLINGVSCFLEEQPWQEFFTKVYDSEEPLADNGRLMRSYAVDMVKMPGLQSKVINILERGLDTASDEVRLLTDRARYLNSQSRNWRNEFTECLAAATDMGPQEYDSRMSQFAAGVTFHVLSCMLLAVLDPVLRLSLIKEAEDHARELRKAQRELSPLQHGPAFYVAQKARISEATLVAAPIWKETVGSVDLIDSGRFTIWCKAIQKFHSPDNFLDQILRKGDSADIAGSSVSLVRFGFDLLSLDRRLH